MSIETIPPITDVRERVTTQPQETLEQAASDVGITYEPTWHQVLQIRRRRALFDYLEGRSEIPEHQERVSLEEISGLFSTDGQPINWHNYETGALEHATRVILSGKRIVKLAGILGVRTEGKEMRSLDVESTVLLSSYNREASASNFIRLVPQYAEEVALAGHEYREYVMQKHLGELVRIAADYDVKAEDILE